jgi:hypothetical protein
MHPRIAFILEVAKTGMCVFCKALSEEKTIAMTWNDVMGLVSTLALSLPVITIIMLGLAGYRSFPALLIYHALATGYNLLSENYITAPDSFIHYYGIVNNLLDAPLMLFFLSYFATSPELKNRMKWLIAGFIIFEITILSIYGFTLQGLKIILGPGILLVLSFSLPFFVRITKITITHHKAAGKALIAASILFAYGCYSIIYVMYYLMDTPDVQNTFLVFFFISTFYSVFLSAGILIEKKRVKKLSELKIVRKELSEIYKQEKKAGPLKPAIFDFDKDLWS